LKRFLTWRRLVVVAMLATLLLGVSGCAGGVRATSWPGLTAVGEQLYAADLEQVVVLNAADSEVLWAFPMDPKESRLGVFYVTPAVDEEYVVVASQVPATGLFSQAENVVWALDRETGALLWRFDGAAGQYVEGGALGGDVFVIGNSDGNVYALDVRSGDLKWQFETGHRVWAKPLIVGETVYVGSMDHHLYALRLSDGELVWDFQARGAFAGTPAFRDGTLYLGAFDDRLYAVDIDTGVERWNFAGENWFWGGPVVYGDAIYAVDVKGNVYALDAETGEQVWHQSLDTSVRAGPAVSEDGSRLFISGEDGALYALDTLDGFATWPWEKNEGQMLSTPVVSGSVVYEMLIYGSYRIRARHVDNGREVWAYPRVVEEQ
jgi:outer membrane protein assembly factor BamB